MKTQLFQNKRFDINSSSVSNNNNNNNNFHLFEASMMIATKLIKANH